MWNLIPWKKTDSHGDGLMVEPFERELSRIRNDFDYLLDRIWNGHLRDESWPGGWGLDLDETETHYVARMDAPGFEAQDFDISIQGNRLLVKAQREESKNGKKRTSYRYGSFERVFPVPEGTEVEQVEAIYRNGVLELKFPKGKEAENVKRIAVKAA
jgi:HSP20 family protein